MQKAAALRDRFQTNSLKVRIPVLMIAPRRDNRGGQYPQDERVRELAAQIVAAGFSQAEADHEGVCVQEYPAEQIVKKKKKDNPNFQTYDAFIRDAAQGPLKQCFDRSGGTEVTYGTLSHSHLCLVLRAIVNGAKWPVPDGMVLNDKEQARLDRVVDKAGNMDMAAVAANDPVAKRLALEGILMQVLRWEIMEQEPTAASLISQSLNRGAEFALRTNEVTALRVECSAVDKEV